MKSMKFTQEEIEMLGYAMNFNLDELEKDVKEFSDMGIKSELYCEILKMRNVLTKLGVEREQC